MAGKGSGAFFGGMILGGAIGAIAGMWIDPRTARRVRHTVREMADQLPEWGHQVSDTTVKLSDRVCHHVTELSQDFRDDWRDTTARLQDAAIVGFEASRREYRAVVGHTSEDSAELDVDLDADRDRA